MLGYLGAAYSESSVSCYLACNFTSQDYLIPYAKLKWQDNMPDCPI